MKWSLIDETQIDADSTRNDAEDLSSSRAKRGDPEISSVIPGLTRDPGVTTTDAGFRLGGRNDNEPSVFANEVKQSSENADNDLGVGPLSKEPARISLLSHFTFTFLIIAIVAGALAGAGWYFRDEVKAGFARYNMSVTELQKYTIRTLDDPANGVGLYTSMAIGSDGYPVIAYLDNTAKSLKIYKCYGATCSTGTATTLDDPVNNVGYYTSLAIGSDGYPVISYYDATAQSLKLYKCNNVACSSGTASTLDDPANIVGFDTSIAIGTDGYPVISYSDATAQSLKLYKCNDVACSSGTASTLDDPANIVGRDTSIDIGHDGYPVISHYDNTAKSLKLYKCNDIACSSGTASTLDDPPNQVGQYTSLAIGRDGNPVISYTDATAQSLKLYKCNDVACTSGTALTIDDLVNSLGYYTSLAIGRDGYPVISYYDATAQSLKFAYVGNRVTMNTSPKTIETDGLVGYWTFDGQDITGTSTVLDRSSSHATGTMVNMATSSRVMGKFGQGLQFDGVDDYINMGTNIGTLTKKTVTAWVKARGWGSASNGNIVWRGGSGNVWAFDEMNGALRLYQQFSNVPLWGTTATLSLGKWYFVSVTYDNSSTSNVPVFYINGSTTTSSLWSSAPSGSATNDSGWQTNIGRFNPAGGHFDGTIDDVRIYNRVLSADEIKNLYNAGAGVKQGICGEGGVRDADGNVYGIVQIGTQCWLDRNMNVGTRVSGFTTQTNNATIEKYCYSDTASNCTDNHPKRPDGGLYQWDEAMQYVTTEGARGICPAGWHVPTDTEWYTLENYLKASSTASCSAARSGGSCSPAGTKLKSGGDTSFEGNLTGYSDGAVFSSRDSSASYRSSSENGGSPLQRTLSSSNATISRTGGNSAFGLPVRCVKDSN